MSPTIYELVEQTHATVNDIHGSQARKIDALQARLLTANELLTLAFTLLEKSLVVEPAYVNIKSRTRVIYDQYKQTCDQIG